MLGDGSVRYLGSSKKFNNAKSKKTPNNKIQDDELLWAIRGGGGLSFGIITEFYFEPFPLPKVARSFVIKSSQLPELQNIPAVHVIQAWENMISPDNNPQLIGTNLKVVAKAVDSDNEISENAVLEWQLNGHFGGTCKELKDMMYDWACSIAKVIMDDNSTDPKEKLDSLLKMLKAFNAYFKRVCDDASVHTLDPNDNNPSFESLSFEHWDKHSARATPDLEADDNGLSLEPDGPAPHKITSKMPTEEWGCEGRKELVKSLQSTLLQNDDETNIAAYITLGAINGPYYRDYPDARDNVAFPYTKSPFTIQYQAWWNQCDENASDAEKKQYDEALIPTRNHENRAQDWIESCRNHVIPDTCGSFISFKDSSIPTADYFSDNYQRLVDIKKRYSEDKKCYLRSRKTII